MFDKTHDSYGVNEVLLASALGGIVFGIFAGQPLCIVGVTGPIAIFNYTVYEIVVPMGIPYFPFMAWICLWSMVMHMILAAGNAVSLLKYVTKFSCDLFGCFINVIYIQKGVQILTRQFAAGDEVAGYLSVVIALLVMIFGMVTVIIGNFSRLFKHPIRKFFADYGLPLTVVFFTGFAYFPGRLGEATLQRLPTRGSFTPTTDTGGRTHGWFIHFWDIAVGDVFLAIPFAILLTLLFYFDHNVSSLICQGTEFPLRKPASFHWDFFLLGITTGVSGLIGIPAPNGLIPQAPLHTMSLCVNKIRHGEGDEDNEKGEEYIERVVEQRVTNLAQGLLILGTMSGPLLTVLGLIPQGVLAGLFWMMGLSGFMGNEVIARLQYVFNEDQFNPRNSDFRKIPKLYFYGFVLLECLGTGAEVAITQTIAAVGFPAVLILLVVIGCFFPRFIPKEYLDILDGPAGSEFILENLSVSEGSDKSTKSGNLDTHTETVELPVMEPTDSRGSRTSRLRRRESHSIHR